MERARLFAVATTVTLGCAVGTTGTPFGGATDSSPSDDDDDDEEEDTGDSLTTNVTSVSSTGADTEAATETGSVIETGSSSTGIDSIDPTDATSSTSGVSATTGTTGGADESSSSTGGGTYEYCPMSDSLASCNMAGGNSEPYVGSLDCVQDGTLETPDSWDFFVLDDLSSGDCVHVEADNVDGLGVGDGDITAVVIDANGNYYGLEADYSELDDETACTNVPWNSYDCPSAGVTVSANGPVVVGVAQWGTTGLGCTEPSPYTLWVAVNGSDVDLSGGPELDDLVVDPFMCP